MPDKTAQPVQVEFIPEFKRNIRQLAKTRIRVRLDLIEWGAGSHTPVRPNKGVQRTGDSAVFFPFATLPPVTRR